LDKEFFGFRRYKQKFCFQEEMMRKSIFVLLPAIFILSALPCFAEPSVPDLVGTWTVKGTGSVILKGNKTGDITHWKSADQKTLNAEAKIIEQKGRIIKGEFISSRAAEKFIGIISVDGKMVNFVDEDGYIDLMIINKDKMHGIYRHVKKEDSVIADAEWIRKK